MVAIILKFILAVIISALLFAYSVWIKPQQGKTTKWHTLLSLLHSVFPVFYTLKRRIVVAVAKFYVRLKNSENVRRFFIRILLIVLLVVQIVDAYASDESLCLYNNMANKANLDMCMPIDFIGQMLYLLSNTSSPIQTAIYTTLISFVLTSCLFNYKIVNVLLLSLRNSMALFIEWSTISVLLLIAGGGQYFIISESMICVLIASCLYPNKKDIISFYYNNK